MKLARSGVSRGEDGLYFCRTSRGEIFPRKAMIIRGRDGSGIVSVAGYYGHENWIIFDT